MALNIWDKFITTRDKIVYDQAGFGKTLNPGAKPALLVIDVTTSFIGDKPESILESIKRFSNSCGEVGWQALPKIKELLEVARRVKVPIMYTAAPNERSEISSGLWLAKHLRSNEKSNLRYGSQDAIPDEIKPQRDDVIIEKRKPSAFFGTPLAAYLVMLKIDTLIVTGCTTSGCVRATVVDAFSYNYSVLVVEDCVFDRGQASHAINLFDMNQKYSNVVSLASAKKYLALVKQHS